ncbi:MAG: monovalent cation/H(+) antiporter subunit G [Blastochloris sp.]|nr:monovalent cation/H(+) antiporter subunit G [Blastochloris sp.]
MMFSTVMNIICALLMLIGSIFMLISSLGIVRLPDMYMRMSATSKAATLGAACVLLAMAFYFREVSIVTRALAGILFVFATAPIGAHMLGRAGMPATCRCGKASCAMKWKASTIWQPVLSITTQPTLHPTPKNAIRANNRQVRPYGYSDAYSVFCRHCYFDFLGQK